MARPALVQISDGWRARVPQWVSAVDGRGLDSRLSVLLPQLDFLLES